MSNKRIKDKVDLMRSLKQDMRLRLVLTLTGVITLSIMYVAGTFQNIVDIFILIGAVAMMYVVLKILFLLKKVSLLLKFAYAFIDVFLITLLIIHTGGIHSPFYLVYVLMLLYEGLTLGKKKLILFLILSIATGYVISIVFTNYDEMGLSIEYGDIVIAVVKFLFIILFGFLTMLFEKKLLEQRVSLNKVLSENINLSVKLKKFNQELIDRVITATNSLENEAELNLELYRKTQYLFMNTTKALISAIDAKDPYTYGHTERMASISIAIFDAYVETHELANKNKIRDTLELAALLHDIGKIGIHDKVLLKPGSLNEKEWEEIKKHPIIGSNILESIEELDEVSEIISHHHEKHDGTGYISGLKGNEIPFLSRIISIADAFDAMISSRPYRKKLKTSLAIAEIEKNSGTQFDPELVEAFKKALGKGTIK